VAAPALAPVRSVFRYSATRALETQRQLTEWQLAQARLAERQIASWFELYRVGLEASLRFTESATRTLVEAAKVRAVTSSPPPSN
jgi:hypothetical protein